VGNGIVVRNRGIALRPQSIRIDGRLRLQVSIVLGHGLADRRRLLANGPFEEEDTGTCRVNPTFPVQQHLGWVAVDTFPRGGAWLREDEGAGEGHHTLHCDMIA
jgi:hypothetical protein